MLIHDGKIEIETTRRFQLVDITEEVRRIASESGVSEGLVLVYTPHTTAAVRLNEDDPNLHQDMESFLRGLVPPGFPFRHDSRTVDGRPNAWGHLLSLLMGSSECLPLSGGEIRMGGWQSIFFVELDGGRAGRNVMVRVMGE